ncbi:MAG: pectinesterase family protein, partial [Ignavibacteriaceae bacterium]
GRYTIFVKKGIYKEKLLLSSSKVNVVLRGEDRDSTVLTYDDYAGIAGGTSGSYSVGIDAPDFTAVNITFRNTVKNDQTVSGQQAVALRSNEDRQAFYNCKLLGYQDTYYAWGGSGTGRVYMKNCYIEGSVDFIFGRDIVLFDSCELHVNRNKCSLTAASTDPESQFGFVFKDCNISYDSVGFDGNVVSKIYLGRAWQAEPRTVFMNTYEPSVIDSLGWNQQPINTGIIPALYGVYQDYGPGYNETGHAQGIGSILTSTEAADYTIENIFSKNSNPGFAYDWIPSNPVTSVKDDENINQVPLNFQLFQNYPNPFNPSTTIKYGIPQSSHVKIILYDILGREVATIVNEVKNAGYYTVKFNASSLASGVYFYRIEAGNFVQVKKMMLLK